VRNQELVHARTIFGQTADHPLMPAVAAARAYYTAEAAERAVGLMREIYDVCREAPCSTPQLESRMSGLRGVPRKIAES
jgi:hypothetical protein